MPSSERDAAPAGTLQTQRTRAPIQTFRPPSGPEPLRQSPVPRAPIPSIPPSARSTRWTSTRTSRRSRRRSRRRPPAAHQAGRLPRSRLAKAAGRRSRRPSRKPRRGSRMPSRHTCSYSTACVAAILLSRRCSATTCGSRPAIRAACRRSWTSGGSAIQCMSTCGCRHRTTGATVAYICCTTLSAFSPIQHASSRLRLRPKRAQPSRRQCTPPGARMRWS